MQAAIAQTLRSLPSDITAPSYQKVNPADDPILYLALTSKSLPLSTLSEYGENLMAQRISMVQGVAQVQVFGSQKYAVRVQVDPRLLAAKQVGIDEVSNAIRLGNVNLPSGILWGPEKALTLRASGQLEDAAAFRSLIVAYRGGAPVRLDDVGKVLDSVQNDKVAAWFLANGNEDRGVILAIQRQPGTNTVAVAEAVRERWTGLRQQLPASVSVDVLYDRSESISGFGQRRPVDADADLRPRGARHLLFPAQRIGDHHPEHRAADERRRHLRRHEALGYNLDNLSLMALTLSVGFVVDDAIVMLENIVRHMEMGKTPMRAALDGLAEIGFTILRMTISLAAVFIPHPLHGRAHRPALPRVLRHHRRRPILISGLIAMTLTPMLCSRFSDPARPSATAVSTTVTEAHATGGS